MRKKIRQNGKVVACAIDYEGLLDGGNVKDHSVEALWKRLGDISRKHHRANRAAQLVIKGSSLSC